MGRLTSTSLFTIGHRVLRRIAIILSIIAERPHTVRKISQLFSDIYNHKILTSHCYEAELFMPKINVV